MLRRLAYVGPAEGRLGTFVSWARNGKQVVCIDHSLPPLKPGTCPNIRSVNPFSAEFANPFIVLMNK